MSAYSLIPTCRDARLVRPGNVVYTHLPYYAFVWRTHEPCIPTFG